MLLTGLERWSDKQRVTILHMNLQILGFGFFEVDQTTLTAMAEIALTYIIVLAQAPA